MEKFLQIRRTLIRIMHPISFLARNVIVPSDIYQLNTLNGGGIGSYQFSVDSGGTYIIATNPYTFNGLSANIQYKIRVRDNNGCESPAIP